MTQLRRGFRVRFCLMTAVMAIGVCGAGVAKAATYTVGVEDADQRPMSSMEQGQYRGYARELLDAFAAANGDHFEYVALPIKRLFSEYFQAKSLDFKFPDNPQWRPQERQGASVSYSASLLDGTAGLMVRSDHLGRPITALRQLGTLRGFTPWVYQPRIDAGQIALTENTSMAKLVQQLRLGRLDAVYLNIDFAASTLQDLGLSGKIAYDPTLPHVKLEFQMSTLRHPEMIKALDAFLRRETRLQNELRSKYRLPPLPPH